MEFVTKGLSTFCFGSHLDKQAFGVGQYRSLGIEDLGFSPMFTLFAANDAALDAQRHAGGDRAQELDFHVAGHGSDAPRANGLAHAFVKECGNNAPVQVAGMALETLRNCRQAHDGPICGKQELQPQTSWIGFAATEAAV